MWRLDKNKIYWKERLGKGASGSIYPYRKTPTDNKWVVKYIHTEDFGDFMKAMQEIILGFNLNHPNVLPVKGFHSEEKEEPNGKRSFEVYIKLERMKCSLNDILRGHAKSKELILENQIIQWFYGLTCGLEYLHDKRIAHMDVNPNNILVDEKNNVKLTDIGIAKFVEEGETTQTVTSAGGAPGYWAPEVQMMEKELKKKDLYRSDVWSLGKTILKICLPQSREFPYFYPQEIEMDVERKLGEVEQKYSKTLADILRGLLKYNNHERPTMEAVKKSLQEKFSEVLGLKKTQEKVELKKEEQKIEEKKNEESFNLPKKDNKARKENNSNDIKKGASDLETNLVLFKSKLEEEWRDLFDIKIGNGLQITVQRQNSNQITDERVKALASQIATNLKSLPQLNLDFSYSNQITDKGVKALASQISTNLNNLQQLNLHFVMCDKISDEGVKALALLISTNLRNLKQLNLYFSNCNKITDEGVKTLVSLIANNLKNLKHLILSFFRCEKITDEGFKALASQISTNLPGLKQLNLDIFGCRQISKQAILSAMDALKFLQFLKIDSYHTN